MGNAGFYEYVMTELFRDIDGITGRKMFGGYGVYKDGVCFGLIEFGKLFCKVDETNKTDYQAAGSSPFTYPMKNGKTVMLSFWEVPTDILEDRSRLPFWIEKAVLAAKQAKKKKK